MNNIGIPCFPLRRIGGISSFPAASPAILRNRLRIRGRAPRGIKTRRHPDGDYLEEEMAPRVVFLSAVIAIDPPINIGTHARVRAPLTN